MARALLSPRAMDRLDFDAPRDDAPPATDPAPPARRRLPVVHKAAPIAPFWEEFLSGTSDHLKRRRASRATRDDAKLTLQLQRTSKKDLFAGQKRYPLRDRTLPPRPRTWGECQARGLGTAESPCAYLACRYHLAIDVTPSGGITLNRPSEEPQAAPHTCTLRVVEAHPGGLDHYTIADILNITHQGVSRMEVHALGRLAEACRRAGFSDVTLRELLEITRR
mgnify:CR=1 FL=1